MKDHRACRRKQRRFPLSAEREGIVTFAFPRPDDPPVAMRLRDVSRAGLSFELGSDLPGLEVGDSIDGAIVRLEGRTLRGDLLVMHLTPGASAGAVCGALFYPAEDADILALRALVAALEEEGSPSVALAGATGDLPR